MNHISEARRNIHQRLKEQKTNTAVTKHLKSCADCHKQLEFSRGILRHSQIMTAGYLKEMGPRLTRPADPAITTGCYRKEAASFLIMKKILIFLKCHFLIRM